MTNKSNQLEFSPIGIIGAGLILLAVIGGYLSPLLAFWKLEGNVPTIIDGGVYIVPLGNVLIQINGSPSISAPNLFAYLIYGIFAAAGILGFIGAISGASKLLKIGWIIGIIGIPVAILLVTRIIATNGLVISVTEWSGLFSYNVNVGKQSYTYALWIGFYMCAGGSYLMMLAQKRNISA